MVQIGEQIFIRVNGIDKDIRDTTEIERESFYVNCTPGQLGSVIDALLKIGR